MAEVSTLMDLLICTNVGHINKIEHCIIKSDENSIFSMAQVAFQTIKNRQTKNREKKNKWFDRNLMKNQTKNRCTSEAY